MFLQRFLMLLVLWALSLITTNVIAASSFGASPAAGNLIKFNSTESGGAVSQTIRITNSGVDPLEITSAVFGLTNPSNFAFSGTTGAFPFTIASGSSSFLTITCTPDLTSYLTYANLGLTTNDPLKPAVSYTLACTRNSTGALYESYPAKNTDINSFGDVNVGATKTRSVVIFNTGDTAMNISSLSFSGTDASSFSIIRSPTSPLNGGSDTYFVINCSPTKAGLLQASLIVNTDASNVTSIAYGLSCNGVGNSAPTDISLDNQSINGGSPANTFVANISTIDPDAADTHTYSLPAISSLFTIKNNQLFTSQTMPLSVSGGSYSVTIVSTDNGGLSFNKTFNINVIPKVGARLQSNPPPNSLIDLGKTLVLTTTLGQTNTGQLEIIEAGDMDLTVSASILGITNSGGFKVSPSSMVLADGSSSQFFTVECTPTFVGIHSAQLELSTNSASTPSTFTYPLRCEGLAGAGFSSNPPPNQKWVLGKTQLNQMLSRPLQISETGDMELKVTPIITGINAADFKVPLAPITLPNGSPPQELAVECTPSAVGIRTATLELTTNDPKMPTASYPLECEGVDNAAYFSSMPAIGQKIQFGKTPINQAISHALEITETGSATINVMPSIKGINAGDFKISPTSMSLPDGSPPQIFNIECKPQAEGIRTATLELVANVASGGVITPLLNTASIPVSYPLECEGTPPSMFNSNPLPNSLIVFNSDPLGTPVSQPIQITNRSNQNLTIDSLDIQGGAYANTFSILNGALPINIAPQTSFSLGLQCTPAAELLQGGFLHLTTNDPANHDVTYGLACIKRAMGAIYVSLPRVGENIYFNNVIIGRPEMRSLFIFNGGDTPFAISDINITSTTADVFRITNMPLPITAPISVNAGEMKQIDIACNPTQEGLFSADLSISTDAGTARRAILPTNYTLTCRSGINNAPTDIILSTQQIKPETPANTLIADISTLDADVNDPQTYTLQDSSGLFVLKGRQLWTAKNIPVGSTGFDIKLKSTDAGGLFIEKDFHLTVGNLLNQFSAEVVTAEGVKTIVDETELLTVKGYVQPLPEEVGKIGDVFVVYHYTSLTNGNAVLPITLLKDVPLQAKIELPLYSGRLIYLPGQFDIILGYRINGKENKGLAKNFSVRKNHIPTDFSLSRNTLVERSSVGTAIGKFVTQDTDKDDFFRYVLTRNPGTPFGYFRIVGDELQMTESFPLTFTNNSTLEVGVRVIDGAGEHLDRIFTIKVIENTVPHIGGEIRSNGYAIRGTKDQIATLVKDQTFTVNSWIQPPSIHLNKVADILYKIVYTPISGAPQIFEGIWTKDKTLTSAVDIEMAKDFSLDQLGTYEISIGYKLKDGSFQILTSFQKFRVQG
jgi:hypothetical protein